MARPMAVLDANVLYPARFPDVFIRLAIAGHYQARWTTRIPDEYFNSLRTDRPDLSAISPDAFVMRLIEADADGVVTVIDEQAAA